MTLLVRGRGVCSFQLKSDHSMRLQQLSPNSNYMETISQLLRTLEIAANALIILTD